MLSPGTVLQRGFVIDRVLGQGGMGCVYLARQTTLGDRLVALKETILSADPGERAQLIELLQREARILASLDHPGVVKVMDFFQEGDSHFFAMEYIDGSSLHDACEHGPVAIDKVFDYADQLCDILTGLHERVPPVIIRDLKPANVLVTRAGRIKIIDFGIANVRETQQAKTQTVLKGAGTPGYAPVEQFSTRGGTDHRSDIYGLGGTLYTLLTCQVPPWSVDLATGDAQLIPPRKLSPKVSPELEAVILKMMALKKDDRYASASQARQALAEARKASLGAAPSTARIPVDLPDPPPKTQVPPPQAAPPVPQPQAPPQSSASPNQRKSSLPALALAMVGIVGLLLVIPIPKGSTSSPSATPGPTTPSPALNPTASSQPMHQGSLQLCQSQLKNLGDSLAAWSKEKGSYPERLAELPKISVCPTTDLAYDYQAQASAYTLSCSGNHLHEGVPIGFPSYTSAAGLVATDPWLQDTPKTAQEFARRARSRASLGQLKEAAQDYEQAVQLDPSDAYSHLEAARAYLDSDNLEAASRMAYRAVVLDPQNPDFYAPIVEMQLGRGEPAEALKEIEKLAQDAESPTAKAEIQRLRCLVAFYQGDLKKAQSLTDSFAQESPSDAEYFRLLCALARFDGANAALHGRNTLGQIGYKTTLSGMLCGYVAVGFRLAQKPAEADSFLLSALPRSLNGPGEGLTQLAAGKLDSEALISQAQGDPNRLQQAHALSGLLAQAAGHTDQAQTHLQWVRDHGQKFRVTYPLCLTWLKKP